MKTAHLVPALLWAAAAHAGTYSVGEVAVVEDTTGAIHNSMLLQSSFCQDAAKGLFQAFPDQYDGVVSFSSEAFNDLQNVQQGTPVRQSTQGLGLQTWNNGASYGSPGQLDQCVFMASLAKLPTNPDAPATVLFGLPLGITGIELLGHEYGHHWLLWVTFDKNDGKGKQDLLRGFADSSDPTTPGMPNGHWSYFANSVSPMYGSKISLQPNGKYKLEGADRKYTELDQYLMGLRDKSEVGPMWALDDGSGHGSEAVPVPKGSSAMSMVPMTRVDFTIDDIIRAEGPRVPAFPNTQKCFRVAFVLVTGQGKTASAADLAKVDAYRVRFEQWFNFATDGRGTMDTRLNGNGCVVPPSDGGTVIPDAGTAVDAGTDAGQDAGAVLTDAGSTEDAGTVTEPADSGAADAGHVPTKDETRVDNPNNRLKPGCGCGTGAGVEWIALLGSLALARRRFRS
jgi:hypothetical protein